MRKFSAITLLFILTLLVSGCNPFLIFKSNRGLLHKNKVVIKEQSLEGPLKDLIRQKPNRKIILLRFHLPVYKSANYGKPTKFKRWLKENVGEPPVLYDSLQMERSKNQMLIYLFQHGYFNAEIRDSLAQNKRGLYTSYYLVDPKQPYKVASLNYNIPDSAVLKIVQKDSSNSLIKLGALYNENTFSEEATRITRLLKTKGYYYFEKVYISYDADSSLGNHMLELKMNISNRFASDSIELPHKPCDINKVYIVNDFRRGTSDTSFYDTIPYKDLLFLSETKRLLFKPSSIYQHILIKPDSIYNVALVDRSNRRLNNTNLFRYINVRFEDLTNEMDPKGRLNCFIELTPLARRSFGLATEGTHSSGNLGVNVNFSAKDRNTFRGAELLELKVKGGLEAQRTLLVSSNDKKETFFLFNTLEVGPELSLNFQRFLLPFSSEKLKGFANPKTSITTAYNFQRTPLYERSITNLSFSYQWRQGVNTNHTVTLFEVNGVKLQNDDSLVSRLESIENKALLFSYQSHLTTVTRYTYVFNNQRLENKQRLVTFFTGNIEVAGNTLRAFNSLNNSLRSESGNYLIAGLRYEQFVKVDGDIRFYMNLFNGQSVAYRLFSGFGVPYGNSSVLPFEKAYVVGGSNSIRAWPIRQIGPGAYKVAADIFRSGDIKLESSAEYRFNVAQIQSTTSLQGAFFVDAGNVWLLNNDPARPGAQFHPATFANEIAMGTGFGLRINFNFVIFRLDYGLKVRDPGFEDGHRWIGQYLFSRSWQNDHPNYRFANLNIGIGYPF